jgi:hypothetical protein
MMHFGGLFSFLNNYVLITKIGTDKLFDLLWFNPYEIQLKTRRSGVDIRRVTDMNGKNIRGLRVSKSKYFKRWWLRLG